MSPDSKPHSAQELAEEMTYVFAELLGGAIGLRSQGMTGAAELIEESVAYLTDQRDGLVEQHEALLAEWRDYKATTQDVIDGLQEQFDARAEQVAMDAFAMWQMGGSESKSFAQCVARVIERGISYPASQPEVSERVVPVSVGGRTVIPDSGPKPQGTRSETSDPANSPNEMELWNVGTEDDPSTTVVLPAQSPASEPHVHEWIDARNEIVESGEICLGCMSIRAASNQDTVRKED